MRIAMRSGSSTTPSESASTKTTQPVSQSVPPSQAGTAAPAAVELQIATRVLRLIASLRARFK